jgi:anti-sigma B factor antagonist
MSSRTAGVGGESFQIERRGDIAIVTPSSAIEQMPENLVEQAAQMVLAPLREGRLNGLVVDLGRVNYFGSVFISFLLRCHLMVKRQGAELVLAGVSDRVRELLRLTSLDTLWALYASKAEALEALGGSD